MSTPLQAAYELPSPDFSESAGDVRCFEAFAEPEPPAFDAEGDGKGPPRAVPPRARIPSDYAGVPAPVTPPWGFQGWAVYFPGANRSTASMIKSG